VDLDEQGRLCAIKNTTPQRTTFALIFDYASIGTIQEYLIQCLKDGEHLENWKILFGALCDVADGLKQLHRRSVVHR
jgi:hypothetical protein